jgi:predicted nucleic acid-binding protein
MVMGAFVARSRGLALPFVDLQLTAHAIEMEATILTADKDFDRLKLVKTENWLN